MRRLSWVERFRMRQYLLGSLWILPLVGAVLGSLLAVTVSIIDDNVQLPDQLTYSSSTASGLLTAIVSAMVAFTGFVVTISVLVIQMATGTFSPRYMRLWYRDRLQKAVLAVLLGTLSFSMVTLRRSGTGITPNLGVLISGFAVVASIVLFLLFLDRMLHRLRPVAVAQQVMRQGLRHFSSPVVSTGQESAADEPSGVDPAAVVRSRRTGSIQAIDRRGLLGWATSNDCVVVLLCAPGDFVSKGSPIAEVYTNTTPHDPAVLDGMFALGIERTFEQDPAFAIRVTVDVATRALSPAVNDPTTAVQVLDHLEVLLREIGSWPLSRRAILRDEDARARVVIPTLDWADFLTLSVTEIRQYGASSIQVLRRLRAMLADLRDVVLAEHRPAVDEELRRLDATVDAAFGGTVDQESAGIADQQGIGGPPQHRVDREVVSDSHPAGSGRVEGSRG
jgi:uncharacterized membrane protein